MTTVEFNAANNVFVLDKVPKTAGDWGADADFNAAKNFIAGIKNSAGSSLTVQQAVDGAGVGSRGKGMVNGQLSNYHGSSSENIGVGALGEDDKLFDQRQKSSYAAIQSIAGHPYLALQRSTALLLN
ncbi:MAG: hypothetical protein WDN75_07105 [Bacteroidota bacterium]